MERVYQTRGSVLGKYLFIFVVLLLISATVFWAVTSYYKIQSSYQAAADTISEIGIYAQGISSIVNKLPDSENDAAYQADLKKIRSLLRNMELKHASMLRGNPAMLVEEPFAAELIAIYRTAPLDAATQVQAYINNVHLLLKTPEAGLNPDNVYWAYLKSPVKRGFIEMVSQTIRNYNSVNENRTSDVILIAVGLFMAIIVLALGGYLVYLRLQPGEYKTYAASAAGSNVASVLREFRMIPEKTEQRIGMISKKRVSAQKVL